MKILIFGGTTEGREIAHFLSKKHDAVLSVASDYGKNCADFEKILVGKMNALEIKDLILSEKFSCAIDATHPFAKIARTEIKNACDCAKIPLLRFSREESESEIFLNRAENQQKIDSFDSIRELSLAAAKTSGGIFVSTGTKDLPEIAKIVGAQRLFVRVLPSVDSIKICLDCGVLPSKIIAMQGPFSLALNRALFLETDSRVLITKLSGKSGGVDEKISAALSLSMKILALRRPFESGKSIAKSVSDIENWLNRLEKSNSVVSSSVFHLDSETSSE